MTAGYVHGYSGREAGRLGDQADTLAELLHAGTAYPPGSRVLEVGCGVGAQTAHLAAANPGAHILAFDVSHDSLTQARARVTARAACGARVEWCRADLLALPFAEGAFDHLFVCFVLEHLPDPQQALAGLRPSLRPGGTITVIEGDHGSCHGIGAQPLSPAEREYRGGAVAPGSSPSPGSAARPRRSGCLPPTNGAG